MSTPIGPSMAPGFVRLAGVFYRAVEARHRAFALEGSRGPGRYSSPAESALYLSASPEGVEAAMTTHRQDGQQARTLLSFEVRADRIFDLRNHHRCSAVGIDPAAAAASWREAVARGGEPPSWSVARRLKELGADGLIDPSRQAPGLWHLVLFRWNRPGAPQVTLI